MASKLKMKRKGGPLDSWLKPRKIDTGLNQQNLRSSSEVLNTADSVETDNPKTSETAARPPSSDFERKGE